MADCSSPGSDVHHQLNQHQWHARLQRSASNKEKRDVLLVWLEGGIMRDRKRHSKIDYYSGTFDKVDTRILIKSLVD